MGEPVGTAAESPLDIHRPRADELAALALTAVCKEPTRAAADALMRVRPEAWCREEYRTVARVLVEQCRAKVPDIGVFTSVRAELEGAEGDPKRLLEYVALLNANSAAFRRGTPLTEAEADETALLSSLTSDVRNAERFRDAFGLEVRHADAMNWLAWDGTHWVCDAKKVRRLAHQVGPIVRSEATDYRSPDLAKKLFAHAKRSEGKQGIDALLKEAAVLDGIDANHVQFDSNPWLLNCPNCTVDLRTGRSYSHDRFQYITRLCPTAYEPEAQCPRWLAALDAIFEHDAVLVDYFQWASGYSLTGSTMHQCFFILIGDGANGKSTVVDTLRRVVGRGYGQQLDPEQLLAQKYQSHPTSMAALRGVRFLSAVETSEGRQLNESRLKGWTGGDRIRARFIRRNEFEFMPEFKLWLATNHRPVIRDHSGGMWRRVRLIPFNHNFAEDPNRVKDIGEALASEAEGILTWAVQGAIRAAHEEPELPKAVKVATDEYRSEQDTLGEFIDEEVVHDGALNCSSTEFYDAFKYFCNGRCGSQKALAQRMKARGYELIRIHNGRKGWRGIALASSTPEGAR